MFYSTAHPPLHTYCGGVVMNCYNILSSVVSVATLSSVKVACLLEFICSIRYLRKLCRAK